MEHANDTMKNYGGKEMMEALFRIVGAECKKEEDGDWRDEEGLLVCHVCGKRKEIKRNIPYLGVRVHPIMCDCGKKEYERKEEIRKMREEQKIVDDLFKYSLIDDRFKISTFENFKETKNNAQPLRTAKNYVDSFDEMYARNKGLLFYGEPGTGKTYMASCIANALLKKRVPLIVTSILKLTSASGPFSKEAEEQALLLRKMNAARLLFIDDLGSERGSDYKLEQVFEVIDSRYGAKKPMIVTTNMTLEQMQKENDIRRKRIYQRIIEVCFPVKFSGTSWRLKVASSDYEEIEKILTR